MRNVTLDDYLVRALSLPSEYGQVAKAYIENSKVSTENNSVLDLYILGFDLNKKLTAPTDALKTNLRTYLSQYKMNTVEINKSIMELNFKKEKLQNKELFER